MRYSGASLVYQLTSIFAGGLAPLIAIALLAANGGSPELVAVYMMAMAAVSVVATFFARETYQEDIEKDEAQERPLIAREPGTAMP